MIGRFVRKSVGTLARNWLRKRIFFLAKLPVLALGFVALLLTTDLFDTLKTMWAAGEIAAATYEQTTQINQQIKANEQQNH